MTQFAMFPAPEPPDAPLPHIHSCGWIVNGRPCAAPATWETLTPGTGARRAFLCDTHLIPDLRAYFGEHIPYHEWTLVHPWTCPDECTTPSRGRK